MHELLMIPRSQDKTRGKSKIEIDVDKGYFSLLNIKCDGKFKVGIAVFLICFSLSMVKYEHCFHKHH